MAEWSDQFIQMQRNWVEQQQKFMQEWLKSMRSAGGGAQQPDWRQAADVMEQQVSSALDAQKRSLHTLIENMNRMEGVSEEVKQVVGQMEQGMEQWVELQQQMWKVWFNTLREASPTPKSPTETMVENWEDMVKRTMSIQEQWLSQWTGGSGASGGGKSK